MLAKLDLDERIAHAFETDHSSEALASLLEETIAADEAAKTEFDQAHRIALDPATRPVAVQEARKVMEDAQFRRDRMAIAATKVEERHRQALKAEETLRQVEARAQVIAERDQLAADLKELPTLFNRISTLLTRLSRNNRRLAGNPTGPGNLTAEALAVGWEYMPVMDGSIVSSIRLPSYGGSSSWPPVDRNNWVQYP